MSTALTVLLALLPAAQEDPSIAPSSSFQEFISSILPYGDSALFEIPHRFLPIVASLQLTEGEEDNPLPEESQEIEEIAAVGEDEGEPISLPAASPMDWVDELMLDWGTARIGPGILWPHLGMNRPLRRPMTPRPDGPSGSGYGPFANNLPIDPGPGGSGGPDTQTVPEPASLFAWVVALAGAYGWKRRLRKPVALHA